MNSLKSQIVRYVLLLNRILIVHSAFQHGQPLILRAGICLTASLLTLSTLMPLSTFLLIIVSLMSFNCLTFRHYYLYFILLF